MKLRVLVACEFSGIVRDAFVRAGHDAMSCDLLPYETQRPDGWDGHYQGDVRELLTDSSCRFDLMIAFPPCTYLANSGVRWLYKNGQRDGERWAKMILACELFNDLLGDDLFSRAYHIPRIAIENPIQHGEARQRIRRYDQIVQPWMFGHGETKATCLWLKNLPPLVPTSIVEGRTPRVHRESPGPERWKNRSRTLPGIAEAMATQWSEYYTREDNQ